MDILLSTITLVLAVGLVLYHRTSLAVSLLMIGAALIGTTVLGWTEGTSWIVFIVLSAIVAIPAVRQSLFSAKALQFLKSSSCHVSNRKRSTGRRYGMVGSGAV